MKTKANISISIGIIGIAVFLSLLFAVSTVDAAVVKVDPASQTVLPGESFSVNVVVEDVDLSMRANQVYLWFDPNAMQATGLIEGDFLKSGGHTWGMDRINNTEGSVKFGYTLVEKIDVTGSGVIATIKFNTNEEGTFDLRLTDVTIIDTSNAEVPVDAISNGTVTITGGQKSIPGFSVIGVIAAIGILVILFAIQRRKVF